MAQKLDEYIDVNSSFAMLEKINMRKITVEFKSAMAKFVWSRMGK